MVATPTPASSPPASASTPVVQASAPEVVPSAPAVVLPGQAVVIQLPTGAIQVEASVQMPPPSTPWYISPGIVGWLALFGVLLGLLANHLKMRAEIKAAAEEAHKERITAARKEIYSELVGEFVKVAKLFGELPSIDIKENPNYADVLIPLAIAVNRTWLIGEVETTKKAREVHGKVQELFIKLIAHLPAMQHLKERIKLHAVAIDDAREQRDGYLRELRKNTAFNGGNQDAQAKLMEAKKIYEDIFQGAWKAHVDDSGQHQALVAKYNEFLLPQLAAVMKGVQEFMYDARIEMGIKGENELLSAQTDYLFERAQKSLEELAIVLAKTVVKVI